MEAQNMFDALQLQIAGGGAIQPSRFISPPAIANSAAVAFPTQNISPHDFFQWYLRPQLLHSTIMPSPPFHCPILGFPTGSQLYDSNNNNMTSARLVQQQRHHVNKIPADSSTNLKNILIANQIRVSTILKNNSKMSDSSEKRTSPTSTSSADDDQEMSDIPISSGAEALTGSVIDFTRLAMRGCDTAEKLAHSHRTRPCFKKIDSLCARLKQDLLRPDGVLANINSQGIAWAVKDFIFVFTRIINAWTIIKGYVYNTPVGLNRVKSSLSPDFSESFFKWEAATTDFVENLMQSFVSLDQLVQSQRTAYHKFDPKISTNRTTITERCKSNDDCMSIDLNDGQDSVENISNDSFTATEINYTNIVENSEESQRKASENGAYFRTGLYNPLKNEKPPQESPNKVIDTLFQQELLNWVGMTNNEVKNLGVTSVASQRGDGDGSDSQLMFLNNLVNSIATQGNDANIKKQTLGQTKTMESTVRAENEVDVRKHIKYLIEKMCSLDESKYFFTTQFTKNYLPDFLSIVPNCIDFRTIVLKVQVDEYKTIYEVVHDLKQIIYCVKLYLQSNPENLFAKTIFVIESELENFLAEEPFSAWNFSCITGDPTETIPELSDFSLKK